MTISTAPTALGRAIVLTYHSHHVVGSDYAQNDHIAFPKDLQSLTAANFRVVSLRTLMQAITAAKVQATPPEFGARLVALTFDDGPVYDVADFDHPEFGHQSSFLNAMRDFRRRRGYSAQPDLHATSFVIASPEARRVIEDTPDRQYTYLSERSMGDDWWLPAIDTGLIGIANHSWDHLHPGLDSVAHSEQVRADFRKVRTLRDADAQIANAAKFIAERTDGRADPFFAFPFGHYNDFLIDEYLPHHATTFVHSAFSADPRAIAPTDSRFCIPRFICGHHWRSPLELEAILNAESCN